MNREAIAQLRARLASIGQQVKGSILRVPFKARLILGLFLIAAIFMAIYTALTTKDSMLHVKVQHGFHNAQVSVWVDGDLAYSGAISGAVKKRFGFLPSDAVQGSLSQMIPVHSGQHTIRVRVAPEDAAAQDDTTIGEFAHNGERELFVAARHSGLSLAWQGAGTSASDAPSSSSGWLSRYAGSLLLSVAGSVISALTGFAIRELPGRLRSAPDAAAKTEAGGQ